MVSENSIKESESSHLGCISYRYFCIIYYFYGQSESHHRSNEKTSRKCSPKAWESIFKPLPIFNICEQQVLLPWPSKQCFPLTNKSLVHSLGTSTSTAVTIESEKKCPYFSIVSETQCSQVVLLGFEISHPETFIQIEKFRNEWVTHHSSSLSHFAGNRTIFSNQKLGGHKNKETNLFFFFLLFSLLSLFPWELFKSFLHRDTNLV